MNDLAPLIGRVMASTSDIIERHKSFGVLVTQYQMMAYHWAYGMVGDIQLAQDIVQEAFITAYQHLHNLREPRAFPGWLRRIVMTHCHRVIRGKEPLFLPLEEAMHIPDPAEASADHDIKEEVLAAIRTLPKYERIVTSLFYIEGYSQREVARFLDVPVTTVNNRLHASRKRLKERMRHMVRHTEQTDGIAVRVFNTHDWDTVRTIIGAMGDDGTVADSPAMLDGWVAIRKGFDETKRIRRHYIAEEADTKQSIGYGSIEQQGPDPHWFRMFLCGLTDIIVSGMGDRLYDQLLEDCRALNAVGLWMREWEYYIDILNFGKDCGFIETDRVALFRLDLAHRDDAALQSICETISDQGIEITTLSEERKRNPDYLKQIVDFWNTRPPDPPIPYRDVPAVPMPLTTEYINQRLNESHIDPDAYFIAKQDDAYLGIANLRYPPAYDPRVSPITSTMRWELEHTGYDIRQALHGHTLRYAYQRGYERLESYVNTRNVSRMLFYTKMGFTRRDLVILEKTLEAT